MYSFSFYFIYQNDKAITSVTQLLFKMVSKSTKQGGLRLVVSCHNRGISDNELDPRHKRKRADKIDVGVK